jgi:hypothetical protein
LLFCHDGRVVDEKAIGEMKMITIGENTRGCGIT